MKHTPLLPLALMAALAASAAMPAAARAQIVTGRPAPTPEQPRAFLIGLGVSVGTVGIGLAGDVAMVRGDRVFSGRLTFQSTMELGLTPEAESLVVSELGVMYGRGRRVGKANWGSVSAGLALVSGDREGETFVTVGIPLQAQYVARGLPHMGATLSANLNLDAPFASLAMSVRVGRVP
ncbi:MAG: hypothetical protein KY467_04540 [Gemmatimonadetes bacterium]|nr:hypothetical protein [Gemmatimonadota bacterium]